jgi:hypothetical protein
MGGLGDERVRALYTRSGRVRIGDQNETLSIVCAIFAVL